jgi:hypothetical protein
MTKSKYLLFLSLLIFSCKSQNNSLYEFDPRSLTENKITLTDIADDIYYIPLDNTYSIGLIYDKIKFINNSIYLSAQNTGVLEFNREGKLLRKIGSIGRGPGEYTYCYSFTVDDKTETIYIQDSGNIIKVFSKTGLFLRSFSLSEYGDMIDAIESYNSMLFTSFSIQYENARYEWIVFDTLGKVIKKKERTSPKFRSNAGSGDAYKYENELTYWNSFTDTVFSILPDLNQKASFIISPGEHRLPKSGITAETMSAYMWFRQIFESSRFIFISYFFPLKKYAFVLIDKNNTKPFSVNLKYDGRTTLTDGIINDLDGGIRFIPRSYFMENSREYFVGLINPYQIQSLVKSVEFKNATPKYSEKKKELEKLANSLKETDNPVLMVVRLKK